MLEKFRPDSYTKSIFTINYDKLLKKGVKCLLFDLDNTICPVSIDTPTEATKNLFYELKEKGFHVIIMSNSPKHRVEPFKTALECDSAAFALKPKKDRYIKILELFKYTPEEVTAIGDQLVTDIFGANRMGLTSILVNPISKKDGFTTNFNRILERQIEKKLRKKDLFERGKYYE